MSGDDLELVEGTDPGFIKFDSALPPQLMCDTSDVSTCSLRIEVTIETTSKDVRCYRNKALANRVPQAMVGFYTDYEPRLKLSCGLVVDQSNWYHTLMIPVAATIDRLIDGDQTRELYVHQSLVVGSEVVSSHVIKKVEVRSPNLNQTYIVLYWAL